MDALTTLSLAANILQFVQFTSSLLQSTRKIYKSASGVSDQCEHLGNVYSELSKFSVELGKQPVQKVASSSQKIDDSDVVDCAKLCMKDCDALLGIINKLRVRDDTKNRWWHSFAKAIRECWKSSEIESLKARIGRHRDVMILKLCTDSW